MSKPIKCMIVDDEEMATRVIENHLKHIPDFEVVGIYHSAVEAFLALDSLTVDVLFLDIQMPKITGIDMLRMMKQQPLAVLTTAFIASAAWLSGIPVLAIWSAAGRIRKSTSRIFIMSRPSRIMCAFVLNLKTTSV